MHIVTDYMIVPWRIFLAYAVPPVADNKLSKDAATKNGTNHGDWQTFARLQLF